MVDVCKIALESRGYRILTAATGETGVSLARRHLPDMILSDINMPGGGGDDVLRTLRADPELFGKQIVLMTGNPKNISPRSGMALGADDFLVKPFTETELVQCVEARLRRADLHWRVEEGLLTSLRSTVGAKLPTEFINPIAGILGLVEILRDEVSVLAPEDIDDLLHDISDSGMRLFRTLKNYLMILDLQGSPDRPTVGPEFLSAHETRKAISAAVADVLHRRERKGDITVTLGERGIAAEASALGSIVSELVDNACRFSRKGTPVRVDLGESGALSVKDEGCGMTALQIENIGAFNQFDSRRFALEGLGLGLVLAQKLVARCGAAFTITSEVGVGTTVTVTFRPGPGTPSPGGTVSP